MPNLLQRNRYIVSDNRFEIFLANGKTIEGKKQDVGWIVDCYRGEEWLGTAHATSLNRTIADALGLKTVNRSIRQIVEYLQHRGLEV